MTYSAHILHILSLQKIRSKNSHTFLSFFFLAWKRQKLPGKWANCEDGCFMCKCHTYHRDYVINDRKYKHGTEWEEGWTWNECRKVWFENWIQLFCFYWCLPVQKIPAWRIKQSLVILWVHLMLCISKFQYEKVNGRLSYIQVILKNELKTNIFIAQTGINLFVLLPYLHLVDLMNESVSTIL